MPARYGSLPFKESIDFFRAKQNIPTERWADIWRDGHNNGFAIAGALKNDLLNDFRKAVDSAIAEGKSIGWFKKNFKAIRAKHGWNHTGNSAWRSKVIYDTNIRQAYNAGRYEQLQHFEVWEYQHGDSRTPRPLHLSWHKKRLLRSDPWWQTHFPQNGWGCKCKVIGRTKEWLNRKGHTLDATLNDGTWEWTDKATGEVHQIPRGIDPSFDYAPQKSTINSNVKKIAKQKEAVYTPQPRIAPTAFSSTPSANVHSLNKALNDLKTTSAAPQITQLETFLNKHQTKTVFVQQKEMNPRGVAATKIADDVELYLGKHSRYKAISMYTLPSYLRTEGFTSSVYDHVVVKAIGSLTKVDTNDIKNAIQAAILLKNANKSVFTFAELLKLHADSGKNSAMLINWIHEIGHQVHFKAGTPFRPRIASAKQGASITRYAQQDHYEWHAEMFVAWLLDRKALAAWNSDIAEYMDKVVTKAIARDKH